MYMFFYNFIKKRTLPKLTEKYDRHFGFIEHVMLSCNTLEQLKNAWDWAREYCNQNRTFEHINIDFDGYHPYLYYMLMYNNSFHHLDNKNTHTH